jgi:homoserine dehydrogenase
MKRIGLVGFGCVGQGVYQLLKREKYSEAMITKIVVKEKKKPRVIEEDIISFSVNDLFHNGDIDIIIEAIDQADQAFSIVKRALKNGIPVITANKKMVAEHLDELIRLQREYKTALFYEAAVCGAIPVVRKIEEQFGFEPIQSISGIFNGTSNYILTKLFQGKLEYAEALEQAQALGYAESDPSNDVEGIDPKFKTIILTKHAFGIALKTDEVFNYGIKSLTADDIEYAKSQNLRIRLVPSVFCHGNKVSAFVLPTFVASDSPLFSVENEFNSVVIESEYAGVQVYTGRGAGAFPTAFSIFSDLRSIIAGERYQYTKSTKQFESLSPSDVLIEVYVRFRNPEVKRKLDFSFIREGFLKDDFSYIIGETTLEKLLLCKAMLASDQCTLIATGKRRIRTTMIESLNVQREKNAHLLSA